MNKKIKILNLYASLGGNRYKWDEVANIEVTAVENDPALAKLYQERFPNDIVIVGDAHDYLLNNYKFFDFIWTSPPCPTHSRINISQYTRESWKARYPDMKLYQEVIFLTAFYKGLFVVENVIPYYKPLIQGKKRGRHLYWTNFNLSSILTDRKNPDLSRTENLVDALSVFHDFDFRKYKGKQRIDKIARNLVDYEAGKTIFQAAERIINKKPVKQIGLFSQITNK